jgi:outer membrane protein assembly factor BamD
MGRIAIGCLIILLVLTGCSSLQDRIDKFLGVDEGDSAQELAWDGMDAYESGKYLKAIEKFQKLKDFYPFSKYAILAGRIEDRRCALSA